MLKICDDFADEYDVKFNTNKSVAMCIGNRYNKMCEPFVLSRNNLQFICSLKYLGIVLLSHSRIKFCVEHVKVNFFRLLIVYIVGVKVQTLNW